VASGVGDVGGDGAGLARREGRGGGGGGGGGSCSTPTRTPEKREVKNLTSRGPTYCPSAVSTHPDAHFRLAPLAFWNRKAGLHRPRDDFGRQFHLCSG
jgi:hypothetical protein